MNRVLPIIQDTNKFVAVVNSERMDCIRGPTKKAVPNQAITLVTKKMRMAVTSGIGSTDNGQGWSRLYHSQAVLK